ncbi:MAG: aminobenzoyl-glutamate transport protein [Halioglobus sp.]|jgi:aminobenzoyl-glutamate transport protein
MTKLASNSSNMTGFLGWIERSGNKLPDPVFIFVYCILAIVAISVISALAGLTALHPTQVDVAGNAVVISAESLLSGDNIQRLLVDMPATFTGFHPLGYVLVVMLGAGVAERSGFFGTAMSGAVSKAPIFLLTPAVAFIGMVGNLAADAAYVVLIPLAGVVFAAAGRHPIAGIAAAFAGVSGGFSANILPGQLDALLFGITEAAAETIQPAWDANIAGNAYFIIGMTFVFLPAIWFVTDKIIEPKLGPINSDDLESSTAGAIKDANSPLSVEEVAGLKRAGMACLGIVALWVFLTIGPGTPLIDEGAIPQARYNPLFQSLVAGFFILFLAAGWAYGSATGSVRSHRDIVKMMSGAMGDLAYYLVLAFAAAHFVAMFNWSNLGLIFAIKGAAVLEGSSLPDALLLSLVIIIGAIINLFIGSASAKWALLAPVLVPMLMLIGISPEMSTAAYRVGDGATNIITPLMPYFPLILIFCQRWQKEFGLGSLVATMLPYSMMMLFAGIVMTVLWVVLGIPLGPNSPVGFSL